ncbi:MAG: EscU/YscU/HrcU family type III secretion system export apparatus switch protein [Pseudomonadota bacterium]
MTPTENRGIEDALPEGYKKNTTDDGTAPDLKPLQNAVAITYHSNTGAPKVVAKGRGLIAEQIIARAREHGVFVHHSKELVTLLMQVELDDQIPPALYRAVAELLAWLYRIETARTDGGKVS